MGLSAEEASAASISSPKRTTAETSIKPVKIEIKPDKNKMGKLPFRAQ